MYTSALSLAMSSSPNNLILTSEERFKVIGITSFFFLNMNNRNRMEALSHES